MIADWMFDASCRGMNNTWWFDRANFSVAKEICKLCPVKEPCLDMALANDEEYGVWGGMAKTERDEEAKRRTEEAKRKKVRV